jgi:hypothetical protein
VPEPALRKQNRNNDIIILLSKTKIVNKKYKFDLSAETIIIGSGGGKND